MAAALERMRAGLRPYHDRIEQTLDLMDAGVTRADYTAFLARTFAFVEPCEAELRRATGDPPLDLAPRWKTARLRQNLAALGIGEDQLAAIRRAPQRPRLDAWPAALGYLYVIEGSTLGGQVLLRHLVPRLSLTTDEASFLRGYDREVGAMWKVFLAALETALAASRANESAIMETARDTFVHLEAWHRQGCPPLRSAT